MYIELTQGFRTLIDDADFDIVGAYRWYALRRGDTLVYAMTNRNRVDGSRGVIGLHRLLLPDSDRVDHVSGDGLDNRRANLRAVTHTQNMQNRKMHKNNTSGFKGVTRDGNKWRASIRANRVLYRLGYFGTPEEAAHAYDEASRRLHGEFGRTNF